MIAFFLLFAVQDDLRLGVDAMPVSASRDAIQACAMNQLSKGNSVTTRLLDGGVALEARFRSMVGPMGGRSVLEIRDAAEGVTVTTRYQHPRSLASAISLARWIGGKCFKADYNKWAMANGQKQVR